ncbi:OB-fold domain-containing protein [Humitalea sp. 24SJ18S-53]|uniref:OB-fold domain-containing protein n=1 Tax=Humitalea sp. 24SJ18S-53 TaxID=3422307 RepID=UPI003D6702C1
MRDPTLYAPSGQGDDAVLLAMREPGSGAITFPRSPYGCTTTGLPTAALEPITLTGRARVLTCITVHQPLAPGMVTPLLVARLQLDEGPVLDGVVEGSDEAAVPPGTQVQAVLVQDGACRFRPVAA